MVIRILYLKYNAGVETVYLGQTDFAAFDKGGYYGREAQDLSDMIGILFQSVTTVPNLIMKI